MVGRHGLGQDLHEGTSPTGQLARRAGIGPSILFQVRYGRGILPRGAAEPLLRGDGGQVHRRVRVDQDVRVAGAIRDQASVHRQRIAKPSVLEREVAQ